MFPVLDKIDLFVVFALENFKIPTSSFIYLSRDGSFECEEQKKYLRN